VSFGTAGLPRQPFVEDARVLVPVTGVIGEQKSRLPTWSGYLGVLFRREDTGHKATRFYFLDPRKGVKGKEEEADFAEEVIIYGYLRLLRAAPSSPGIYVKHLHVWSDIQDSEGSPET
jgi:hypothetical protein